MDRFIACQIIGVVFTVIGIIFLIIKISGKQIIYLNKYIEDIPEIEIKTNKLCGILYIIFGGLLIYLSFWKEKIILEIGNDSVGLFLFFYLVLVFTFIFLFAHLYSKYLYHRLFK